MLNTSPNPRPTPVTLRPIALPRYEVHFRSIEDAYQDSRTLASRSPLQLSCTFREPTGTQLVIDLHVPDVVMSTTLLFRLIQQHGDTAIIEWVPRRRTDPELMELWLNALESALPNRKNASPTLSIDLQQSILDHCRRTLASNPFTVLNLHWTARQEQVHEASQEMRSFLKPYLNHDGLGDRLQSFIRTALERIDEVTRLLTRHNGRQVARKTYVPSHQLDQAIELAKRRFHLASLRDNAQEFEESRRELIELVPDFQATEQAA